LNSFAGGCGTVKHPIQHRFCIQYLDGPARRTAGDMGVMQDHALRDVTDIAITVPRGTRAKIIAAMNECRKL
jgi:hypothetical protein